MLLFDRLNLSSQRKYTDEGFLTVPARIARTGVQDYTAAAMGVADRQPTDIIRVFRPADEVFSEDSLASFQQKPVTHEHPPELVTADNAKQYSVGMSGPEVTRDGSYMKAVLTVTDGATIDAIKSGKVELSNGYVADIDWSPGITDAGLEYDAVQRNIRGNHIAVVSKGRAGPEVKLADSKKEDVMALLIDGVEYEASNQVVQAVAKLQAQLKDAEEKSEKAEGDKSKAEEDKDEAEKEKEEAMAAKDAAEAKTLSTEALDKLVADRGDFVAQCKSLVADMDCAGKTTDVLKAEVVAALCPGVQMDSASADYVNARFDILVEDGGKATPAKSVTDAVAQTVQTDAKETDSRSAVEIARAKFMADARDQWKKG